MNATADLGDVCELPADGRDLRKPAPPAVPPGVRVVFATELPTQPKGVCNG